MKHVSIITSLGLAMLSSINGFSQQIYFNKRYNLCNGIGSEVWSAASGAANFENGYIIAGATVDTIDFWWRRIAFVKLDSNGDMILKRDFGDTIADYYLGYSGAIKKTPSGFFLVAGVKDFWQSSHFACGYLMKLNQEFDTIYTKTYNLNSDLNNDTSINFTQFDICENHDLVFSGSLKGSYLLLLKSDSLGNTQWYKTFHYGSYTLCTGYSVIQTLDGGFALGGFQYTIGQPETGDPIIVKTDGQGNQEWVKYLGGLYLDNKALLSRSSDDNIIMGTTYGDYMQGDDPISRINIAKLDNDGNIIWNKKYGSSYKYNYLLNIRALNNGDIIATGFKPDVFPHEIGWILKVNENGDSIWYREYSYLVGSESVNNLYDVIETSDNGLLACGYVYPVYPDTGNQDAWVIKLDSIGCDSAGCDTTVGVKEHGGREAWEHGGMELWPNPCRGMLNVECLMLNEGRDYNLSIYNIFGREVQKIKVQDGQEKVLVNIEGYPLGVYLAILKNGLRILESRKFVVVR
jgi:hypothetical protein